MLLMRISGSKKLKLIDETDQKDQTLAVSLGNISSEYSY